MTESTMNEAGNEGGSVTVALPESLTSTISALYATRRVHGATSPIGRRCSNLGEMLPNYQKATDPAQRANLAKSIRRQMADLDRLTRDPQ